MTTQQSGFMGPGYVESSQVLVKSLVKAAFRGEPLFRPSRPDFIETTRTRMGRSQMLDHCSGHLGRTSLRHTSLSENICDLLSPLFRPSRPDFIETRVTCW